MKEEIPSSEISLTEVSQGEIQPLVRDKDKKIHRQESKVKDIEEVLIDLIQEQKKALKIDKLRYDQFKDW